MKDFNEFMFIFEHKFNTVIEDELRAERTAGDQLSNMARVMSRFMITFLEEYHNWMNSPDDLPLFPS